MKHLIIFHSLLLLLTACTSNMLKDAIVDFIPGTYIAYYENEFHKTHDTLLIQENKGGNNVYEIIRRYYYTTTVDGKELTPTYKKENWTALFDKEHHILSEQRHGSVISFDPGNKTLKRGNREYKKID